MLQHKKTFIHTIFLLFILVMGTSAQCAAQTNKNDIFARFKKSIPEVPEISNEEFIEKTRLIRKTPHGQNVLKYSMRVPKEWTLKEDSGSSNFLLSDKLFLELNTFYGKPTISGRSRIEISALNVDSNLTTEQWYLKYILESGYTTEGFVTHDDGSVESLMVIMEQENSFYLRTRVFINGQKVIVVKYYVPVHYMQEQAAIQKSVLNSFKLEIEVPRPEAKMQIYRFLDVAELPYPVNWKVIAKPLRSVDRMRVSVVNLGKQAGSSVLGGKKGITSAATQGKMDVTLVSSSVQHSLIDEIEGYKEDIEANGVLIAEKIEESHVFQYKNEIDFAITEVYKGVDSSSKLSEYEFWFTVMVGGNYYYFLMLLTPSRNESFVTWAENTQNYKAMIKGFTPLAGAFLDRD